MKIAFIILLSAALPLACLAQQNQQPKNVKVETEHEHKGASHYHTHTVVPEEHHTITRWHYHNGYKRPKVEVQEKDAPRDGAQKPKENLSTTETDKK